MLAGSSLRLECKVRITQCKREAGGCLLSRVWTSGNLDGMKLEGCPAVGVEYHVVGHFERSLGELHLDMFCTPTIKACQTFIRYSAQNQMIFRNYAGALLQFE